jgi:hypothetical protein
MTLLRKAVRSASEAEKDESGKINET